MDNLEMPRCDYNNGIHEFSESRSWELWGLPGLILEINEQVKLLFMFEKIVLNPKEKKW
jgi:hypothetical protein